MLALLRHFGIREGLGSGLRTCLTQDHIASASEKEGTAGTIKTVRGAIYIKNEASLTRPRRLSFEDLFYMGVQVHSFRYESKQILINPLSRDFFTRGDYIPSSFSATSFLSIFARAFIRIPTVAPFPSFCFHFRSI